MSHHPHAIFFRRPVFLEIVDSIYFSFGRHLCDHVLVDVVVVMCLCYFFLGGGGTVGHDPQINILSFFVCLKVKIAEKAQNPIILMPNRYMVIIG